MGPTMHWRLTFVLGSNNALAVAFAIFLAKDGRHLNRWLVSRHAPLIAGLRMKNVKVGIQRCFLPS